MATTVVLVLCELYPGSAQARGVGIYRFRVALPSARVRKLATHSARTKRLLPQAGMMTDWTSYYGSFYKRADWKHSGSWLTLRRGPFAGRRISVPVHDPGARGLEWVHLQSGIAVVANLIKPPKAGWGRHRVRAYRISDGALLWTRTDFRWFKNAIIMRLGRSTMAIIGHGRFHAVRIRTGRPLWRPIPTTGRALQLVHDRQARWLLKTSKFLYAVDARRGRAIWKAAGPPARIVRWRKQVVDASFTKKRLSLVLRHARTGRVGRTIALHSHRDFFDRMQVRITRVRGAAALEVVVHYVVLD